MPKRQHVFYGRFAIVFAISILCAGLAMITIRCLGGGPEAPQGGRFVLNSHGDKTEVTRLVWLVAYACDKIVLLSFLMVWISGIACAVLKTECWEDDPRRDYSILVIVSAVFTCVLAPWLPGLLKLWLG